MFDIQTQLFESQDLRFTPIDHEKDPEVEAKWTHDSEFMRLMAPTPARPLEGRRWDELYMGILCEEWMEINDSAPGAAGDGG